MTRHGRSTTQRGLSSGWLLAVLAGLSALLTYAVTTTRAAQDGLTREVAAARAQQAAQAALEWARFHVAKGSAATCATPVNITVPLTSGAMPVTVSCPATAFTEGGTPVQVHLITATACWPAAAGSCPNAAGGGDYVAQQVSGIAWR